MTKISDDDLTMLYYGEHDDPALAAAVASSAELSARYDALSNELELLDTFQPPQRDDDYGSHVWQKIVPRLAAEETKSNRNWKDWLSILAQPRFSLAGALSFALVAVLAFTLGRNGTQTPGATPAIPQDSTSIALAGIDPSRLFAHSVSGHLEQVNIVLTQFANTSETTDAEAEYALDMLVANRLYRQAAVSQGKHKVAAFLADLEPLLIELAYAAQSASPVSRERMQQEVRNGLLFRVRVMNNQLNKPKIST